MLCSNTTTERIYVFWGPSQFKHAIMHCIFPNVYILQEDGPLIVDNDYIAMDRTTSSSDDDDNTVGIAVGVTIAAIVVIVVVIVGVVALIWYYQ